MRNLVLELPDASTVERTAPRAATLVEAFDRTVAEHGDRPALRAGADGRWMNWNEYGIGVSRAARALAAVGVGRGDTVALMLRNRPEFHFLDVAALKLGAIPFSIYNTSAPGQIKGLVEDSGARLLITEAAFAPGATAVAVPVYSVDGGPPAIWGVDGQEPSGHVADPSEIATIIYTSGTTGPPKGVQLTHANLLWMARMLPVWWRLTDPGQRVVSWLPMAHVAERVMSHYLPIVWGWSATCCEDPRGVATVLPSAEPSVFFAPPRLWEKLRATALAGPLAEPAMRAALDRGLERVRGDRTDAADAADADHDVVAPVLSAFGLRRIRCALASAAPVAPALIEFWRALGVPMIEGYGLSEAATGVCMDDPDAPRIGTVGLPLPGVELRLANDGELLVRSPSVMVGYRGRADLTSEAIDPDGWLHTGDVAAIDDDGRVRIVDRKKELIINSAGKNMSPANIEATLKAAGELIAQACCIGDGRPYNVALVVLDPETVAARGVPVEGLQTDVAAEVERANEQLSRVEQIKRFKVLDDDWLPDSDELTPTMKLKRRAITAKYEAEIEALYVQ